MGKDDERKTGEEETGHVRNAEISGGMENGTLLDFFLGSRRSQLLTVATGGSWP